MLPQPAEPYLMMFGRGSARRVKRQIITLARRLRWISALNGLIQKQSRLAILGSGGPGKTSIALHVIQQIDIVTRYASHWYFVGCDAATSASGLARYILQTMRVSMVGSETSVTTLYNALKAAPPTLILLNNFESIWEAESDHTDSSSQCALLLHRRTSSGHFTKTYSLYPLHLPKMCF